MGTMTLREIAEKFDVSLSALKRHKLHHMPRYLELVAEVEDVELADGSCVRAISYPLDDGRVFVPVEALLREARRRFRVCVSAEEKAEGRAHSAGVKAYLTKRGEPEHWDRLVSLVEEEWPGFRVVQ